MINGSLYAFLRGHGSKMDGSVLSAVHRFKILEGIARGMEAIHEWHVIHCHLTTSNILVGEVRRNKLDTPIKISGFRQSVTLREGETRFISNEPHAGSSRFSAPEVLHDQCYSYGSDVWAFGCVAAEIFIMMQTGDMQEHFTLFHSMDQSEIREWICAGRIPPQPRSFDQSALSQAVWNLCEQQCWLQVYTQRSNMKQVRKVIEDSISLRNKKDRQPSISRKPTGKKRVKSYRSFFGSSMKESKTASQSVHDGFADALSDPTHVDPQLDKFAQYLTEPLTVHDLSDNVTDC